MSKPPASGSSEKMEARFQTLVRIERRSAWKSGLLRGVPVGVAAALTTLFVAALFIWKNSPGTAYAFLRPTPAFPLDAYFMDLRQSDLPQLREGRVRFPTYPRTSVQQSWVRDIPALVYLLSRYDLIQALLEPASIEQIKRRNPNAMILPFDSMGDGGLPEEWYSGGMLSASRPKEDVTDDCPVYYGEGSSRGVEFNGKNYQDWKAAVSAKWREAGLDGCYLDLWNKYPTLEEVVGLTHLARKMRRLWPAGLFVVNAGRGIRCSYSLNGYMYEDYTIPWWRPGGVRFTLREVEDWTKRSAQPSIVVLNMRSNDPGNELFWQRMRFAIAVSMLHDAVFVSFNYGRFGSPHWANSWWFDELDVDIGKPVAEAYELANGVYVRKFSRGAVVVNAEPSPRTVSADMLGEPYYRFRGGQQPDFNNGQKFEEVTLHPFGVERYHGIGRGPHVRVLRKAGKLVFRNYHGVGDAIILVKEPQTAVAEIIIDDQGGEHELFNNISGRFSQKGMVFESRGQYRWPDAWRVHPANSAYYAGAGDGSASATWTPEIGVPGLYEVFEWHPASPSNASNAPFTITHQKGQVTVYVDQRRNGGRWNSLGVYEFERGTSGSVKVTNRADGVVFADAIKLVYRGSGSTR